jgi:hypothetical protein
MQGGQKREAIEHNIMGAISKLFDAVLANDFMFVPQGVLTGCKRICKHWKSVLDDTPVI